MITRTSPQFVLRRLALALAVSIVSMASSWGQSCGNSNPNGPAGNQNNQYNPTPTTPDPVNVYTGNDFRAIKDLTVWGSVGQVPLVFERYANSRAIPDFNWFGLGHNWSHSFQWELAMTTSGSSPAININYPNGAQYTFVNTSGTTWTASAGCADQLTQSGTDYYLQRQNGWIYHFQPNATAPSTYNMTDITDNLGDVTTLTYAAGTNRVIKVTEPGGRYLTINYTTLSTVKGSFTNLIPAIGSTPPPAGWTSVSVATPTHYRYLRYLSADGGYCDIADVQFLDTHGNVITGTVIGAGTPSGSGTGASSAFDGNTSTYTDMTEASGDYVCIDLGASNTQKVATVRYFPRPGYESRMASLSMPQAGGRFQGSNIAPSNITAISSVVASDGRTVNYNYTSYSDPTLPYVYPDLTSVSYDDGSTATYTYNQVAPSTQPLATEFQDPRYASGPMAKARNVYFTGESDIFGALQQQKSHDTSEVITTAGVSGGDIDQPTATYSWASASPQVFKMESGHVKKNSDASGRSTTYSYDSSGFKASQSGGVPVAASFTNSAYGNPTVKTFADGSSINFSRNSRDLATAVTDELSHTTTLTRNASQQVTNVAYPDSSSESFAYNSLGEPTSHTLRNGHTESAVYDSTGLPTTKTDALGNATTYTYDSESRPITVTDARGNTTSYTYDGRGDVLTITHPDSSVHSYTYDSYGNKLTDTDELGHTTTYTYDQYQRCVTKTDPLGRETQYVFNTSDYENHPKEVILPSGKTTYYTYDADWNVLTKTEGYGTSDAATTTYTYDANGNMVTKALPDGNTWHYTYDNRKRKITETDPMGYETQYGYDAASNLLTVTRPDGKVTSYVYDSMHRKTQMTDPKGQVTHYTYDASGNLLTTTDPNGNTYSFTYDALNRKLSMTYPDSSVESYTYDAVGNLATFTTRAGQVQTFTYDSLNREIAYTWSDSTPGVTRTYDAAGRLLTSANSTSTSTYTYDNANEMLSETQANAVASSSWELSYTYDADGNKASLTYPSGVVVTYGYNNRNEGDAVAVGGTTVASYALNLNGNTITKTLGDGTAKSHLYNLDDQVTEINETLSGTSFAKFDYGYDNLNRRTYEQRNGTTGDVYSYDYVSQVTNVAYDATAPASGSSGADRTVAYSLDSDGNRTSVNDSTLSGATSYSPNNLNQYTSVGGISYGYDGNGNLISGNGTFIYDAQNRLLTAAVGSNTDQYSYDSKNRVVEREINGTPTFFIYDGWNLIEERDSSGDVLATYVMGVRQDELISKTTPSGTVYYHHNALGSVIALTNPSGTVVERYKYDIYGKASITDGSGSPLSASAYGNRFMFTGREYLAEVNLYDYRNRMYSADLGRFLQSDPERFGAGDVNIYRYCGNNAVNKTDAMGLCPDDPNDPNYQINPDNYSIYNPPPSPDPYDQTLSTDPGPGITTSTTTTTDMGEGSGGMFDSSPYSTTTTTVSGTYYYNAGTDSAPSYQEVTFTTTESSTSTSNGVQNSSTADVSTSQYEGIPDGFPDPTGAPDPGQMIDGLRDAADFGRNMSPTFH